MARASYAFTDLPSTHLTSCWKEPPSSLTRLRMPSGMHCSTGAGLFRRSAACYLMPTGMFTSMIMRSCGMTGGRSMTRLCESDAIGRLKSADIMHPGRRSHRVGRICLAPFRITRRVMFRGIRRHARHAKAGLNPYGGCKNEGHEPRISRLVAEESLFVRPPLVSCTCRSSVVFSISRIRRGYNPQIRLISPIGEDRSCIQFVAFLVYCVCSDSILRPERLHHGNSDQESEQDRLRQGLPPPQSQRQLQGRERGVDSLRDERDDRFHARQ